MPSHTSVGQRQRDRDSAVRREKQAMPRAAQDGAADEMERRALERMRQQTAIHEPSNAARSRPGGSPVVSMLSMTRRA